MNIITTKNINDPADFIVDSVLKELTQGKKVLLFLTGGSSIAVGIRISELLSSHDLTNLTIMLTDERYGPLNHPDSNYFRLMEKGAKSSGIFVIPILIGDEMSTTTSKFDLILSDEIEKNDFKIGLFGIGADGHTAGILPGSVAVSCNSLACGYDTPIFSRITMTPRAIAKLDQAVIWAQGENKWNVIRNLKEDDIDLEKQPAQILKKVPLLTIFTDYTK